MSETVAARLEITRKLDEFYTTYKQWTNFTLLSCCSLPALTLLGGPTYILLWTDGPYVLSLVVFALAWLFGSFVLLMASTAIDTRVANIAARRFNEAFPRDTAERLVAVDILRSRIPGETNSCAQTLLKGIGELDAEEAPGAGSTVEDVITDAIGGDDGAAVFIPIEDDGAATTPAPKVEKAPPPRLRYIPLEPERGRDDDSK